MIRRNPRLTNEFTLPGSISEDKACYRVYGSWMAENNQDQVSILNQKLSEFAPSMPHAVRSDIIKQA